MAVRAIRSLPRKNPWEKCRSGRHAGGTRHLGIPRCALWLRRRLTQRHLSAFRRAGLCQGVASLAQLPFHIRERSQAVQFRCFEQTLSCSSSRDAKKSQERLGVFPSCAETIWRLPAVSSREPLFEKRCALCTFDSAPHRIQDAATHQPAATVKTEPIGKIYFTRLPRDIEAGFAKLEESLLKNDAQNLLSQNFLGAFLRQRRRHPVAAIHGNKFTLLGDSWKFKKVERTIHPIECEQPSVWGPPEFVTDTIKPKGHVSIRDLLQVADAQAPVQRRKARRGESSDCFLLRDVGFQCSNGRRAHHSLRGSVSSGNRSTSQPPWRPGLP